MKTEQDPQIPITGQPSLGPDFVLKVTQRIQQMQQEIDHITGTRMTPVRPSEEMLASLHRRLDAALRNMSAWRRLAETNAESAWHWQKRAEFSERKDAAAPREAILRLIQHKQTVEDMRTILDWCREPIVIREEKERE